MTLDDAQFYLEAALDKPLVDVTDEQLREAIRMILERNCTLEDALAAAYREFEQLGKVL